MKIIFVCGSMECGRDGVGDYTRRLAVELIKQGHELIVIALNDKFISQMVKDQQPIDNVQVPVLRIPSALSLKLRFDCAKQKIEEFDPEWISLQFVPYAFQNKGLPFQLPFGLAAIGAGRKWHIMFHELWVGKEDDRFFKSTILASLQKFIIRRLLTVLSPSVLHTHLPLYQQQLNELGWNILALPLFSNIIKIDNTEQKISNNILRVCFFSQVDVSNVMIAFLLQLKKRAIENTLQFEILLLGGSKEKMQSIQRELQNLLGSDTTIHCTGFLSTEQISTYLQSCTLGITPIPSHGLGKSGGIAAFIEHAIPVAVPVIYQSAPPFFLKELIDALLFEPDFKKMELAKKAVEKAKELINITVIARQFIVDLYGADNPPGIESY